MEEIKILRVDRMSRLEFETRGVQRMTGNVFLGSKGDTKEVKMFYYERLCIVETYKDP